MRPLLRLGLFATAALGALTLAGCATMNVSSFVERGVDVTSYRTYDWAPVERLATGDPRLDNNPFFQERLQGAVDQQLAARGLERTTSATADLIIHYHASVSQAVDVGSIDRTYGYCSDCTPSVYEAGTILIDFVDARTNTLVWRGWAEGSIDGAIDNQEWMEQTVDEAVARILETFPRPLLRAAAAGS